MSIVSRIKELCDSSGITINKLEQATGIGRGAIARWDLHEPSISKVRAVAEYFGLSVDDLMGIKRPLLHG